MIDKLAEFLREKWLGIKYKRLIDECLTYVIEDNGSTNAQEGCHDDTVMAAAILLQLLLEGKGEDYVPELPKIHKPKQVRRQFMQRDDEDVDIDSEESLEIAK